MGCTAMMKLRTFITLAMLAISATAPALAQEYGSRTPRFGNTSGWSYDGRDDDRDFRTNGFFPGNFAADPARAMIGAAGIFGSTPERSAAPYPSQIVFGPVQDQPICAQRYRSWDPQSRTFLGRDRARHRC